MYRVFGPTIAGTFNSGLTKINGLTDNTETGLDFDADTSWTEEGNTNDSFDYAFDVTKISPNGS